MHEQVVREFLAYLLRRIEADRWDLMEEFFMESRYGQDRRAALAQVLAEIEEE